MKKVLFIWNVKDELKNYLKKHLDKEPLDLIFTDISAADNKEEYNAFMHNQIKDANAIVGWRPKVEWLNDAIELSLFINPGAGVQHLMKEHKPVLQNKEITLLNNHGHAHLNAQHAMALLLSACNQTITHHNFMVNGQWRTGDKEAASISLADRKIGFLGYGNMNNTIHQMLMPYGSSFAALTRKSNQQTNDLLCFKNEQLNEFLKWTDVLMIAVPHTNETDNLIREKELKLLGKQGILVNMSRGAVVNEEALYNALSHKTIQRAAIDVWYNYSPDEVDGKKYPFNYDFQKLDNIVLSPHRGGSPDTDLVRWNDVIENLKNFANNQPYTNVVDLEHGY